MTNSPSRFAIFTLFACTIGLASGCAVPQPRGDGQYKRVKEPRTGAIYHLYLPIDYVKNNGQHPNNPVVRKWPLVMTFHGMKPYDNARPQEREWEKEADTYGYIVCAPQLSTSSSFMEYPLTKEWDYVKSDRDNVIAIMDHVFATTMADPENVLSTSWSCGGYLAHYFPNRFPHRFSCIATRLSNFSAPLLEEDTVSQYRNTTSVGIFIGDGDLPACKSESEEAVAWYKARGFKTVEGKMIDSMGHRRIPQTAAAFFARQMGLRPLHPADAAKSLAKVHMTNYVPTPQMIARMSPRGSAAGTGETRVASAATSNEDRTVQPRRAPRNNARRPARRTNNQPNARSTRPNRTPVNPRVIPSRTDTPNAAGSTRIASADRSRNGNWLEPVRRANGTPARRTSTPPQPIASTPLSATSNNASRSSSRSATDASTYRPPARDTRRYDDMLASQLNNRTSTTGSVSSRAPTPVPTRREPAPRVTPPPPSRAQTVDISIKGPSIGTAPYYLAYGIELPASLVSGADFLWKDNGVWMGDEPYGVKILETPGVHRITVLMITRDNVEYRGMTTVRVLDRAASADLGNDRRASR